MAKTTEPEIEPVYLTRDEFLDEVFAPHYEAGEHVTFVGPTGSGKTTVAFQMLDTVTTPELPGVVLVMKPRDSTVVAWTKKLEYKRTQTWPPGTSRIARSGWTRKYPGYVFWPRHSLTDIRRDDEMLEEQFRAVLTDCYRKGDRIIFGDELHALQNDLHLKREIDAILMRGRSLGCAGWFSTQRPRDVSLNVYSQAEHLILFRTPDERDAEVYRLIGGMDPAAIKEAVYGLNRYEFVYIGRTKGENDEPTLAVVEG